MHPGELMNTGIYHPPNLTQNQPVSSYDAEVSTTLANDNAEGSLMGAIHPTSWVLHLLTKR